jgi:hypothetical protein
VDIRGDDIMNTHSHTLIGNLLHDYLKKEFNIHLDKDEFIRGNVVPDYRTTCVIHPHFIRFSLGYIQREIEELAGINLNSADIGKEYSFKLGMICHYYADFFCHAHSRGYKQAIVNHLRYERCLCNYFVSRLGSIREIKLFLKSDIRESARQINERTKMLFKEYDEASPSYGKDIYYSLHASAGAIVSLISCSMANIVPIKSISFPHHAVPLETSCAGGGTAV